MQNLSKNKFVLVGAGAVAVIAVLLLTGALKFSFTAGKPGVQKESGSQTLNQQEKLASRATNFGGTGEKPEFSIRLPQGWAKGELEQQVDLAVGSITPEKLPSGTNFTVNIVASISPHPIPASGIGDYRASWKDYMLNQYPSMEFVRDDMASVSGMDAYVFEMKQTRGDGVVVHQLQYVFYVDSKYALGVTASVPEEVWNKYKGVVRTSLESIEKVSSGASETQSLTKEGEEELVSYTNSTLGITIKHPRAWEKVENLKDGLVSFSAPAQKHTANILANKLPKTFTLDEYTKTSLDQLKEKDIEITEQKKTTLSGLPAYKIVYTLADDIKFMQVWAPKGGREYVFTYAGKTSSDYDERVSTAQKMVESIVIE